jgi:mRNA interferase MazF
MLKQFLKWIKIKELLHYKKQVPSFEEREIWWANIGENIGHEENGKDSQFTRPFVIVKKFNKELLFGIPCSSVDKENKYYFKIKIEAINFKTSALLSQARAISSKRLVRRIDKIGSGSFKKLKTALNKAIF